MPPLLVLSLSLPSPLLHHPLDLPKAALAPNAREEGEKACHFLLVCRKVGKKKKSRRNQKNRKTLSLSFLSLSPLSLFSLLPPVKKTDFV